jgi:hypothetical protein
LVNPTAHADRPTDPANPPWPNNTSRCSRETPKLTQDIARLTTELHATICGNEGHGH